MRHAGAPDAAAARQAVGEGVGAARGGGGHAPRRGGVGSGQGLLRLRRRRRAHGPARGRTPDRGRPRSLAGLSRALSDYETGVGLAKAFASSAPKAVRARTPALDNFAALGSSDAISMGEGLVGLALEMAKQAAAAGGADDGSGDE